MIEMFHANYRQHTKDDKRRHSMDNKRLTNYDSRRQCGQIR